MDGFTFLRLVMAKRPTPVMVISGRAGEEDVFKALELGAVDFIAKPSPRAGPELASIERELIRKVHAIRELRIDKVRERLNFDLELEGILATMYDSRTTHCRQVLQRVVEAFGDKVYQTVITKTVKFPESTVAGTPITSMDPSSSGARNYRQLAREVIAAHTDRAR